MALRPSQLSIFEGQIKQDAEEMKSLAGILTRALKPPLHLFMVSFILVLPVGYYPDDPDSSNLSVGVYGGTGQVASVLRSCDGTAIRTEKSSFKDVSGIATWTLNPRQKTHIVIGVRGGYWRASKARFAERRTGPTAIRELDFEYFNPSLSVEGRKLGIGFGVIFGHVPISFDDLSHKLTVSGHLRVGEIDKPHLILSFGENTPLISGGGLFNLGFGNTAGRNLRLFTGLSAGFYDRLGFLHQSRIRLNNRIDTDITFRIGAAGDAFEGSLSWGLIYRFGR